MRIKKYLKTAVISFMISFSLQAQAMSPLEAIDKLISQVTQLQQQIKQLKNDPYEWDRAQALINDLGEVIQTTNGLSYTASDLDQQFKKAFPGYVSPTDYRQQYEHNTQQTLNTLNGVLKSTGLSAKDFANENKRMRFLQNQSQNSQGQLQAIQVSNKIAAESVSQLQLLRQTLIAQTNAQTAYYATQLQNEASAKAELSQILGAGSKDLQPYGSSGYDLKLFNF